MSRFRGRPAGRVSAPYFAPLATRFLRRIRVVNECWLFKGSASGGYGTIGEGGVGGKTLRAHRVSWWLATGEWPAEGLVVRHLCGNRKCVRPGHLSVGTESDNRRDLIEARRSS